MLQYQWTWMVRIRAIAIAIPLAAIRISAITIAAIAILQARTARSGCRRTVLARLGAAGTPRVTSISMRIALAGLTGRMAALTVGGRAVRLSVPLIIRFQADASVSAAFSTDRRRRRRALRPILFRSQPKETD